jgi:hypothetical protein
MDRCRSTAEKKTKYGTSRFRIFVLTLADGARSRRRISITFLPGTESMRMFAGADPMRRFQRARREWEATVQGVRSQIGGKQRSQYFGDVVGCDGKGPTVARRRPLCERSSPIPTRARMRLPDRNIQPPSWYGSIPSSNRLLVALLSISPRRVTRSDI